MAKSKKKKKDEFFEAACGAVLVGETIAIALSPVGKGIYHTARSAARLIGQGPFLAITSTLFADSILGAFAFAATALLASKAVRGVKHLIPPSAPNGPRTTP